MLNLLHTIDAMQADEYKEAAKEWAEGILDQKGNCNLIIYSICTYSVYFLNIQKNWHDGWDIMHEKT